MSNSLEEEQKAMTEAFQKAMREGKLFNVNSWKKKREKSRK